MNKKAAPTIIEERILAASKIVVNMLAEVLIYEGLKDISPLNFRVLDLVHQGISKPTEIANIFSIVPSTLTSALEKLENMRLITRNFSKADRRRVILKITARGEKIVNNVNDCRMKKIGQIIKGMDEDSKKYLDASLKAFIDSYSKNYS